MPGDRYSAVWVSHSSISDFLACPRAYYLKNVYKDPKTQHKIQLMSSPLALGQAVHEVVESLSNLKTDMRFSQPLTERLEEVWDRVSGEKGGFSNPDVEAQYKRRAESMLRRLTQHPGPLLNLAYKINMELPYFWLSEEDNIILCGKIDWLEYLPETESVHIIDFKTGAGKEAQDSLQLPIYLLLASHCQKYPVEKASYWYIDQDDDPRPQKLPDLESSHQDVLKIAKRIKLARQLGSFNCPQVKGCHACRPYEALLEGKGERVGTGEHGHDIYILREDIQQDEEGTIL
jgi:ATP-dependent helicase/DNAse subunit B